MRHLPTAVLAVALCAGFFGNPVHAAQPIDINSLQAGMRYCPAPWGDNREFLDTHYGIDAQTGVMTKHTGNMYPEEDLNGVGTQEQLLYVSPPISVENRFVPPPGYQGPVPQPSQPSQPLRPNRTSQPPAVQRRQGQPAPALTASQAAQSQNRRPVARPAKPTSKVSEAAPRRSNPQNGKLPWWKGIWRN